MSLQRGKTNKVILNILKPVIILVEKLLLKFVDGIVYITEGLKDYYLKNIMGIEKDTTIVPSGVDIVHFCKNDPSFLKNKLGIKEEVKILGYAGGIASTRKLDFIISSFEKLNNGNNGKWALVFIGDGNAKESLQQLGIRKKIQNLYFLGEVEYDRLPKLIAGFDVGVCHLPYNDLFNTSFPMKVLEYIACGIPVLLSDIPAHHNIAKHITNVEIYDITQKDFVSKAMKLTKGSKPTHNDLDFFTWENIARQLVHFQSRI
jgi:glycosyltransferase involved in cell wall biosynthesis